MKTLLKILLGIIVVVILCVAVVAVATPWMDRWGAKDAEIAAVLPGDELLPNAASVVNRAVEIQASPNQIYPWLVQMGAGRGGLYSYSWLETNLLRCPLVNADRIHLEWQDLKVGDKVEMCPGQAMPPPYTVARLDPNKAVVMGHLDKGEWTDLWQFVIIPQSDGSSRLVLRTSTNIVGAFWTIIHPGIFIMERGMLLGIKQRAEGLALSEMLAGTPTIAATQTSEPPTSTLTPGEEATTTPEVFNPAPVEAVISDKARTDLSIRIPVDIASITVAVLQLQQWPDSCLGLAPEPLKECTKDPVDGYRLVLNAAGHPYEYRATQDGETITFGGPTMLGAPEGCAPQGTSSIYSPEDGYCFAYPVRFHRTDDRGPVAIYGPAYGPGPEPLYAALNIEVSRLADGQTLDSILDAFLQSLGPVPMPQTRQEITVSGEKAVMLEVVPGMLGSRDVFVVHGNLVFHFTFWPAPSAASQTAADVEDLYQTVFETFKFLP